MAALGIGPLRLLQERAASAVCSYSMPRYYFHSVDGQTRVARADIGSFYGNGRIDTDAYSFGATLT